MKKRRYILVALVLVAIIASITALAACKDKPVKDELFTDGLLAVVKDGAYGYINSNGEVVIDFVYTDASPFVGGYASVTYDGERYFFINTKGERVNDKYYSDVVTYNDSKYVTIRDYATGKYGVLNLTDGFNTAVNCVYDGLVNAGNDIFVANLGSAYGVLNKDGNAVLPVEYSDILVDNFSSYSDNVLVLHKQAEDGSDIIAYVAKDGTANTFDKETDSYTVNDDRTRVTVSYTESNGETSVSKVAVVGTSFVQDADKMRGAKIYGNTIVVNNEADPSLSDVISLADSKVIVSGAQSLTILDNRVLISQTVADGNTSYTLIDTIGASVISYTVDENTDIEIITTKDNSYNLLINGKTLIDCSGKALFEVPEGEMLYMANDGVYVTAKGSEMPNRCYNAQGGLIIETRGNEWIAGTMYGYIIVFRSTPDYSVNKVAIYNTSGNMLIGYEYELPY